MAKFKAQAEIAVILILIIVGGISVYYAFKSELIPTSMLGTSEEQKSVRDSVVNMIRDGAYSTLHKLNMYGGYLEPQARNVDYAGKRRSYWQGYMGGITYPDIQDNFVNGLLTYLRENKDYLQGSLEGKETVFGDVSVSANMLENKIMIEVNMPTTVKNKTMDGVYRVEMQSRIGEIFEISKKILGATVSNERPFEMATASNIQIENFKDWQKMPLDFLPGYGCEPRIYSRDWPDIKPVIQDIVEKTVASACISGHEKCTQTEVMPPTISLDKIYDGVDINFDLPENFEFNKITLQFSPNPIYQEARPYDYSSGCWRDAVKVEYRINYPVVVVITDALTKDPFIFVMDIFVDANAPGDFSKKTEYNKDNIIHSYICDKKECKINLKVSRVYSGEAISNAKVKFAGCSIGKTDEKGILESSIPCVTGRLLVTKNGFSPHEEEGTSSDELKNTQKEVKLRKNFKVPVRLYEVTVEKEDDKYKISKDSLSHHPTRTSEIMFLPVKEHEDDAGFLVKQNPMLTDKHFNLKVLPEGYYVVLASTLMLEGQSSGGFVSRNASLINKDLYENGIHVVIPLYEGLGDDLSENLILLSQTLPNLLEKCGLGPVSTENPSREDCEVLESELTGGG